MKRKAFALIVIINSLILAASLAAQEGHPLTGTWSGDWGSSAAQRSHLTVVMSWDGKAVTGTINPGPEAIPLGSVALDVSNWSVRIEADGKDKTGKPVHISAEGRIEDLSSAHRKLIGTWTQAGTKGEFRLTRD